MKSIGVAAWLVANWVMPSPGDLHQPQTQLPTTTTLDVQQSHPLTAPTSALTQGASLWLSAQSTASPPTKAEIQLLRQAFSEFYGVTRDLAKSEELLNQVIAAWERQAPDERAGLYRVRGDCYSAMGDATKAIADYDTAVTLLQGPGGDLADPTELPASLLGRARSFKSLGTGISVAQAKQAASDYETYLKLASREEWDTDQELLEDGATRNPYAAWEWGAVLRKAGDWKQAATAHALASQAFLEIGDKARSVIALTDAGIDLAAVPDIPQAKEVLNTAISKTKGVEAREVAVLQRVVAKEGEGRMALAALLWSEGGQRGSAETVLGDACVRLEQLQADAASRSKAGAMKKQAADMATASASLKFSIDDDVPALDVSCFRFKNPVFLESLGWPKDLQEKVIKLETLR
eukprot:CAMPEP_0172447598 /NCGR_PEP_ID=MMETSP1065-20121228/6874_1 /TAXON_ID=265537 /ORGANISM="Amphiprora paludosa, Strain CCMP125" /LENGTH=406 /DNA_ID=CAMNT_0013198935 /DNA_START=45 /DNA_END=1268 /DNA_ORIENTATION=-